MAGINPEMSGLNLFYSVPAANTIGHSAQPNRVRRFDFVLIANGENHHEL